LSNIALSMHYHADEQCSLRQYYLSNQIKSNLYFVNGSAIRLIPITEVDVAIL